LGVFRAVLHGRWTCFIVADYLNHLDDEMLPRYPVIGFNLSPQHGAM
jgi:hypothetical protein